MDYDNFWIIFDILFLVSNIGIVLLFGDVELPIKLLDFVILFLCIEVISAIIALISTLTVAIFWAVID